MKRHSVYRVYFNTHRYFALAAANVREAIQTAREIAERHHSLPPGSKPIKVERIQGPYADLKPIKPFPRS